MSTRSLICVFKDGDYKLAKYSRWDGYPEGQGQTILEFLRKDFNRSLFEEKLNKTKGLTSDEMNGRISELGSERENFDKLYPSLSFDTGGEILVLIQDSEDGLELYNELGFSKNRFCEWIYVLDLDKDCFKIYRGGMGWVVGNFSLSNLPTLDEFLNQFEGKR